MTIADAVWTFAVATVAAAAGYMFCGLLVQDKIANCKRIATKYYRAMCRVERALEEGRKDRGWGHDSDFDAGWDRCALTVEAALYDWKSERDA